MVVNRKIDVNRLMEYIAVNRFIGHIVVNRLMEYIADLWTNGVHSRQ